MAKTKERIWMQIKSFVLLIVCSVPHAKTVFAESTVSPPVKENANAFFNKQEERFLTILRAVQIAIDTDPSYAALEAQANALNEQSIAEDQLPDPTIRIGYLNVPTDTFSRSQEAMTQFQIGVQQVFPPGKSLSLRKQRVTASGQTMTLTARLQRLTTIREVRNNWLDVYFSGTAALIVRDSHKIFKQLTVITRSQYATGRRNQQDVLRAQLELGVLKDREINYHSEQLRARARLARWIGQANAQRPLPVELPSTFDKPDLNQLQAKLENHPLLQISQSRITEQEQDVAIAKESYKPRWMIDVSYSNREGNNPNGSSRSDFVSGMISFSLPLFAANRQDRTVAASRQRLLAADDNRETQRRLLHEEFDALQVQWQYLSQRIRQYQQELLPQASLTANAALQAYQTDAGDFALLMRARINELETHLQLLKLRVDRERVRNGLLFLSGEEQ